MPSVRFHFENKEVEVGTHANLMRVAKLNSIPIYEGAHQWLNCLGTGLCGTCVIEVLEGMENLTPRTRVEEMQLDGFLPTLRLACQTEIVKGSVTVITRPKIESCPKG
jgi:ferredoxin